ncbi:MAG: hypothetical protein M0013_13160, partial [Actinomycetota bacterium]|nr:hypothetical protein [Actinomycetota bacterium]
MPGRGSVVLKAGMRCAVGMVRGGGAGHTCQAAPPVDAWVAGAEETGRTVTAEDETGGGDTTCGSGGRAFRTAAVSNAAAPVAVPAPPGVPAWFVVRAPAGVAPWTPSAHQCSRASIAHADRGVPDGPVGLQEVGDVEADRGMTADVVSACVPKGPAGDPPVVPVGWVAVFAGVLACMSPELGAGALAGARVA